MSRKSVIERGEAGTVLYLVQYSMFHKYSTMSPLIVVRAAGRKIWGRRPMHRRPAISLGNGGPAQILLHDAFLSQSTPHAWPGGLLAVGAPCGAERRGHVGRLPT